MGDPTTASGAGLVQLGLVPDVDVKLQLFRQAATNEIGQALKGGIFGAVQGATVQLTVQGVSAALLAAMIDDVTDETTSISAETALTHLTLGTMVIVPADVKGSSARTNLKTQYLPAVYCEDVGSFKHKLLTASGDDANPVTLTFKAALAATDQDGQTLHSDYGIWFRGDPDDAINEVTPTAWSLPSGY